MYGISYVYHAYDATHATQIGKLFHTYHISNIADSQFLLDKVSIFRMILGPTVAAICCHLGCLSFLVHDIFRCFRG